MDSDHTRTNSASSRFATLKAQAKQALERARKSGSAGGAALHSTAAAGAKKAATWIGEGSAAAGSLRGSTLRSVSGSVSQGWSWGRERTREALEVVLSAPEKIADLVFEDCPVEAYLLPIGNGPKDFCCLFDFEQALKNLKSGMLVRPRIQAWAGRLDLDRSHLAQLLTREFTTQFRLQKEKALADSSTSPANLQQRIEELKVDASRTRRKSRWSGFKLAGSLIVILLATNPITDLLFLAFAIYEGKEVFGSLLKGKRAARGIKQTEQELQQTQERLESELRAGNQHFRQAVDRIEIRVHPLLQEIVNDFREIEGDGPPPGPVVDASPEGPEITPFLKSGLYRERVPEWYLPLLEERLMLGK
ncbi:MAG: hypothetical protein ACE5HT_15145 [Gemmatimonadales bacterium]